ncbi:MAG: DUF433 domain-containing protein [Snowella sp.]|nr:MAG: DUF433 domain-containing protein [Snowella sp.]
MQPIVDISTLVTQTQGICGGRPCIAGTRTAVQTIAVDFNAGMSPEEIILQRPNLKTEQVYAALTYYYANKELMDLEIANYYQNLVNLEINE